MAPVFAFLDHDEFRSHLENLPAGLNQVDLAGQQAGSPSLRIAPCTFA
jgi:hypothetical protein